MATTNIDRVSDNIGRMVDAGLSDAEIDDYLMAEEGYTPERFQKALERTTKTGGRSVDVGAGRLMLQGLTMGGSEELEAFAKNPTMLWDDAASESYDKDVSALRYGIEDYRNKHGVKAVGAELAGALPLALLSRGANLPATGLLGNPLTRSAVAGAGSGAAYGFGTGEDTLGNRLSNAAESALWGAAVSPVIPGAQALWQGVKRTLSPVLNSAQKDIAGDVLNRMSHDPAKAINNMRNAKEIIPGSAPMTHQVARDPGLAGFGETVVPSVMDPTSRIGTQKLNANAARRELLKDIAGGDEVTGPMNIAGQEAARNKATGVMREAAFEGAEPVDTNRVVGVIDAMLKAPDNQGVYVQKALNRYKKSVLRASTKLDDGAEAFIDPRALYAIRKDIGPDIAGLGSKPQYKFAKAQLGKGIPVEAGKTPTIKNMGLQRLFDDAIEEAAPGYQAYMSKFKDMSKPIADMELLQDIRRRSAVKAPDVVEQLPILSQSQLKGLLENKMIAKGVDKLPTDKRAKLQAIMADLNQSASPRSVTPPGSSTAKNLTVANIIGDMFGNGLMGDAATNLVKNSRALNFLYKIPEDRVQELIVDAMLDPKLAADLMTNASASSVERFAKGLKRLQMAQALGVTTGALAGMEMGGK